MLRFAFSKIKCSASAKLLIETSLLSKQFSRHARPHTNTKSQTHHEEEPIIIDAHIPKGPTLDEVVKTDINLSNFLMKIYKTTGLSIFGSLGISYLLSYTYLPLFHPFGLLFGGMAASLGGIFGFTSIPPNITVTNVDGNKVEKWENSPSRLMAFSSIIAGSGVSLAPFLASVANPAAIPTAVGISILVLGGASLYALQKPVGHFKTWESTLSGGLIGLIGINLLSILFQAALGPNLFTYTVSNAETYIGLGLFTALQAYDTNRAIREFQMGRYDHLSHVVQFFLNFKNLLVRILILLQRDRE